MTSLRASERWDERTSAAALMLAQTGAVFESLFERCAYETWLHDPRTAVLPGCYQAAAELIGTASLQPVLLSRLRDISQSCSDSPTTAQTSRRPSRWRRNQS